jgi:hypothetical protein
MKSEVVLVFFADGTKYNICKGILLTFSLVAFPKESSRFLQSRRACSTSLKDTPKTTVRYENPGFLEHARTVVLRILDTTVSTLTRFGARQLYARRLGATACGGGRDLPP